MTGRSAVSRMSRAHAMGLADLIESANRVNGRWQAFKSINLGNFRIEHREDLPHGERYEVTEGGAARRRLNTLADALMEVEALCPEMDIDLTITRMGR